ncbi:hypothetical protein B0T13DRAFT_534125 [Neurospora crassa]|nr:hypothetical protein B0T13DRAFT_534125 [Neurospora crassa]
MSFDHSVNNKVNEDAGFGACYQPTTSNPNMAKLELSRNLPAPAQTWDDIITPEQQTAYHLKKLEECNTGIALKMVNENSVLFQSLRRFLVKETVVEALLGLGLDEGLGHCPVIVKKLCAGAIKANQSPKGGHKWRPHDDEIGSICGGGHGL